MLPLRRYSIKWFIDFLKFLNFMKRSTIVNFIDKRQHMTTFLTNYKKKFVYQFKHWNNKTFYYWNVQQWGDDDRNYIRYSEWLNHFYETFFNRINIYVWRYGTSFDRIWAINVKIWFILNSYLRMTFILCNNI